MSTENPAKESTSEKPSLQRSPSSYEIHQLSPSKQVAAIGRGYTPKRSQSDLHLSQQDRTMANRQQNSENENNLYQVQSVSHEHYSPRTFTREPRKSRNSYHESMHSNFEVGTPGQTMTRRFSQDMGRVGEPETQTKSGSLTWRKPKDLFSQSEWNKENVELEGNHNSDDSRVTDDQGGVVSFANLSKQKNNSSTGINIHYMHQDREVEQGTYKKATRPGYLHINKSHPSMDGSSPTSNYTNTSEWVKSNDGKNDQMVDSSVAAQMHDIRLKLEEKRKRIEHEKALLEKLSKKQRERMGKAAFLQAVKGGATPRDESYYSRNRQFSVEDISEDLDTVRRKWLERKGAEVDYENDMQSEDIQHSIEQLNSSLSDLQSDISRLTDQQQMIQKLMKPNNPPQNDMQAYFLHEQNLDSQSKIPNKWAEPVNTFQNNSMYPPQQNMMQPEMPQQIGGRGHWGQPVIPFGGFQPQQSQQNIPMWQQPSQPMRPPSVEPQMMYGQPMNMQQQMYDRPSSAVPFNQGFSIHPQQMPQNNYNNFYTPNPYYPNEMQQGNPQSQGQFSYPPYQQTNYPVMQNTFTRNMGNQGQGDGRGFHLHRNLSQSYLPDEVDNYNRTSNSSPRDMAFEVHRSSTQELVRSSSHDKNNVLSVATDEFGRPTKASELQHSPPSRPVLGKTFRVPKSKGASPSSPNYKQSSFPQPPANDQNVQPEKTESNEDKQLNDKGFYISFEEEPRKPKPKLKPKHLKARNQQKKIDSESRKGDFPPVNQISEDSKWAQNKNADQDYKKDDTTSETSEQGSNSSQGQPPTPGVGFVIGAVTVDNDPVS